ncbi:MAG TPA: zf-HC2 domain-containing protein [Candidatus Acidoferrales bacterium]
MKCEEVSRELTEHLNQRADSAQQRDVEEHLAGCATCRKRAAELRGIWNVMDELPAIEPSFGFDARVRQRVAAEPRRKWFEFFVPRPRLALAVGVLIALMVLVMKLPLKNPGTTVTTAATQQEDFNAIKNLGVLENYDVVTKMDALSELTPVVAQPEESPQTGTASND